MSLLAIAVAGFAGWVIWRQVQLPPPQRTGQFAGAGQAVMPAEVPGAAPIVNEPPAAEPMPAVTPPRPRPPRINRPPTEPAPDTGMASAGSGMPARPEPPANTPAPLPEIGPDLTAALDAMADGDFMTAEEALTTADKEARDTPLASRVAAWKQLLHYRKGYADLETEAVASVSSGDEYDTPLGKIAIVESTPGSFKWVAKGETHDLPYVPLFARDAIVADWLDERPANDLFVGAYLITKREPDVAAAQAAWAKAASGGADASLLLPLLEDPILVKP